jgi:hypothetical protein
MKYTVKRWLRFSGKAMKAMTPDEVVDKLRHLDFLVVLVWLNGLLLIKKWKTKTLSVMQMNLNQGRWIDTCGIYSSFID